MAFGRRARDVTSQRRSVSIETRPSCSKSFRIAGLGVQVLFGFLLAIPFTVKFVKLSPGQRHLYLASLLFAVLSIVLLSAPVALHRIVFRHQLKEEVLAAGNVMSLFGLAAVALSISTAVSFVFGFVVGGAAAAIVGGIAIGAFAALWFVYPVARRLAHSHAAPATGVGAPSRPSSGRQS